MPSWFWEQLGTLLSLAIPVLIFCGVCAVVGSAGLFLRRGKFYANKKRWKAAWISWVYSVIIIGLTFSALYKFRIDWKVWLIVLAVIIMGFFGYFFVPGSNTLDADHQHH